MANSQQVLMSFVQRIQQREQKAAEKQRPVKTLRSGRDLRAKSAR